MCGDTTLADQETLRRIAMDALATDDANSVTLDGYTKYQGTCLHSDVGFSFAAYSTIHKAKKACDSLPQCHGIVQYRTKENGISVTKFKLRKSNCFGNVTIGLRGGKVIKEKARCNSRKIESKCGTIIKDGGVWANWTFYKSRYAPTKAEIEDPILTMQLKPMFFVDHGGGDDDEDDYVAPIVKQSAPEPSKQTKPQSSLMKDRFDKPPAQRGGMRGRWRMANVEKSQYPPKKVSKKGLKYN
tara:strand:- start:99 stop:824 length:726 start_codon:yes stop_codon:yes gene_type:complete